MKEHFCAAHRVLAIGYGKTPLLSGYLPRGAAGPDPDLDRAPTAQENPPCAQRWRASLPHGRHSAAGGQKDLTAYTGTQRAQKLALMAPHSRRMELTTCFDFVSAGRYPYTGRLGILSAEDRQQVHRALELVGAAQLADRDFNRISDGQRQRILLARALSSSRK